MKKHGFLTMLKAKYNLINEIMRCVNTKVKRTILDREHSKQVSNMSNNFKHKKQIINTLN